ncbi:carboxymuconolactone decarboxylase family protein [Altericroceibacterium spongiae]|uniref:Carboxymuconolactone decarboxylase family protein n=1 Tax=Altericroceibacterium spongiae TaxID=2320269 RepID=A0A420ERJ4_9SPHN|nr:carboxymuconolactone decarboxylase family protein [Altericroceibacterium spongiae]RKF23314.1 carboxymuconolactone decarboxylase family protein [Altericroceibacterium spongiae]
MKKRIVAAASMASMPLSGTAQAGEVSAPPAMQHAAPALAEYTGKTLFSDLWKRSDLSPRDRSIVTVTTLIATGKSAQLRFHLERALDNGVTPAEIGGIITHLAFYSGWPNAVSAVEVADGVFRDRAIPESELQQAKVDLLPPPENDESRASAVEKNMRPISPSLTDFTNGVLFDDLWRRPDLAPRDRSLVTIVALTANGDADQLGFHVQRGLENGLTRKELGEVMGHIAFYAGWPKAFSGANALGKLDQ